MTRKKPSSRSAASSAQSSFRTHSERRRSASSGVSSSGFAARSSRSTSSRCDRSRRPPARGLRRGEQLSLAPPVPCRGRPASPCALGQAVAAEFVLLDVREDLLGAVDHRRGDARQASDVEAVGAVGRTALDPVQEGDGVARLANRHAQVEHRRVLDGQLGQLVIVRREEGAGAHRRSTTPGAPPPTTRSRGRRKSTCPVRPRRAGAGSASSRGAGCWRSPPSPP